MHLDGVVYLDQCNAIFVGFTDATALNAAIAATGWHRADPVLAPLVLDAGRPDYGPIGRLVFIVKGIAYHSWTLDAA
jgi:hypothetical protein